MRRGAWCHCGSHPVREKRDDSPRWRLTGVHHEEGAVHSGRVFLGRLSGSSSLAFFGFGCVVVLVLLGTVGLYNTDHYFVAHFCLGIFLPFIFYGITANYIGFWVGMVMTSIFHFGYELWEDQLTRATYSPDIDEIISGAIGMLAAYFIYRGWGKRMDLKYENTLPAAQ